MGRYDKYFNITVKREIYVELKKLAETHGLSVPDFLALIVKTYNLVETLNKTINLLGSSQYITGKIPVSEDSSSTSSVTKPTRNTTDLLPALKGRGFAGVSGVTPLCGGYSAVVDYVG